MSYRRCRQSARVLIIRPVLKHTIGESCLHAVSAPISIQRGYTIIFPDNAYAAGVQAAREDLIAQGFREVKFNNTWAGPGYRGINANYQTADGFVFELQFHTASSHTAKESGTHALYEQQRLLARNTDAWDKLERAQNAIFDTVPTPSGALGLE